MAVPTTLIVVIGLMILMACGIGMFVVVGEIELKRDRSRNVRKPLPGPLQHEADIAALSLGWSPRQWFILRGAVIVICVGGGAATGVVMIGVIGLLIGIVLPRFALGGRAAKQQLNMERAFLQQLRNLRDRMSMSNQSLDTALQEIGRNPGKELRYVLAPLARGGSVIENIVTAADRSHSPIIENAMAVLLWSRSRSLEALIDSIDTIILPIGTAQLSVAEESLGTLTQQRSVTVAMSGLMAVMFVAVLRVPVFRTFYNSVEGSLVLALVIAMFFGLVAVLTVIVKVEGWTRWDVRAIAEEQERLHA